MTETRDEGSIDDLLGPSGGRFFGEGFRRVEHAVIQMKLGLLKTGRFGLSGEASLSYPSSWSTKNSGSELRPHLSTVDAFVLAVQMIDVLLVKHLGLSPDERAAAWLAAVEFRSGTTPVEALEDVRMYATGLPTITVGSVALDGADFFGALLSGEGARPAPLTALNAMFERGDFDLVATGRALISDPDLVHKLQGRSSEPRTPFDAADLLSLT